MINAAQATVCESNLAAQAGVSQPPEKGALTPSASENTYSCHYIDLTGGLAAGKCLLMRSPAGALGKRRDHRGSLETSCYEGWWWA